MSDNPRQFRRAVMTQVQLMMGQWHTSVIDSIRSWSSPGIFGDEAAFWAAVMGDVAGTVAGTVSWGIAGIAMNVISSKIAAQAQSARETRAEELKQKMIKLMQRFQNVALAHPYFQKAVEQLADKMFPAYGSLPVVQQPHYIQTAIRERGLICDDHEAVRRNIHASLNDRWKIVQALVRREMFRSAMESVSAMGEMRMMR